mmetsp:Transcript_63525/g.109099  ORF Transcript_63525/g.109099 Transcript_63525/m.109099 type:complete len:96 (-) Transcript_63525:134-421(-)
MPCMSCTPTRPSHYCSKACQNYVRVMYEFCDGICLPTNYYYDVDQALTGCWPDVKPAVKIEVERCGCSAAGGAATVSNAAIATAVALALALAVVL